jgi:hypothetical protein
LLQSPRQGDSSASSPIGLVLTPPVVPGRLQGKERGQGYLVVSLTGRPEGKTEQRSSRPISPPGVGSPGHCGLR